MLWTQKIITRSRTKIRQGYIDPVAAELENLRERTELALEVLKLQKEQDEAAAARKSLGFSIL